MDAPAAGKESDGVANPHPISRCSDERCSHDFHRLRHAIVREVVTVRARSNELSHSLNPRSQIERQSRQRAIRECAWQWSSQHRPAVVAKICQKVESGVSGRTPLLSPPPVPRTVWRLLFARLPPRTESNLRSRPAQPKAAW